jgi:hypothetical protein
VDRYGDLTRIRQVDPVHDHSEIVRPQILKGRVEVPICAACLIPRTTASSNLRNKARRTWHGRTRSTAAKYSKYSNAHVEQRGRCRPSASRRAATPSAPVIPRSSGRSGEF